MTRNVRGGERIVVADEIQNGLLLMFEANLFNAFVAHHPRMTWVGTKCVPKCGGQTGTGDDGSTLIPLDSTKENTVYACGAIGATVGGVANVGDSWICAAQVTGGAWDKAGHGCLNIGNVVGHGWVSSGGIVVCGSMPELLIVAFSRCDC